jgi:hypothetical protein
MSTDTAGPVPDAAGERTVAEGPAPTPTYALRALSPTEARGDLIPGILPNGISLLAGAPGAGKTTLISSWALGFRDNQPILGHQPRPTPFVGVLATDRSWESHSQWFSVAGWPDIPHYSFQDDPALNWDRFLLRSELPALFLHGLKSLYPPDGPPPGSVIFADTVAMFIDGNLIDYKRTAVSLGHLNRICRQRRLCCIGTAHMAKQKADQKDKYQRPQDRILGSAALLGFTDTQMFILAPEDLDADHHLFGWVPHHAAAQSFELTRDPQTGLFVPLPSDRNERELQKSTLLDQISTDGSFTTDLVEILAVRYRLSRASTYRLLKELAHQGSIAPGPKRGMYHRLLPS